MNRVNLRYGTRELTREFPATTTIGEILRDQSIRAGLGLPENVTATVNGRTLQSHDRLNGDDDVVFEKQAAAKA